LERRGIEMAISDAIPAYLYDLVELVHLAENQERARELQKKIGEGLSKEIKDSTEFVAQRKIFKVLQITYNGDLVRLKKDIAKMALLDLNDLEGMNLVQRYVYAIWEVCFNEFGGSKEELLQSLENMWGFNSM